MLLLHNNRHLPLKPGNAYSLNAKQETILLNAMANNCKTSLQTVTSYTNKQREQSDSFTRNTLRQPACPCWKALSLFLKREGSTKSQPRASSANSFLRSGSCRKEISFILMLLPANGASVTDSIQPRVRIISLPEDTPLRVCIKAPVSGSCSP